MSVEIEFPVEFLVAGTPVSLQAKRRESIDQWKTRVIDASRSILPEGHFATKNPVAATLFYFPAAEMAGDIDNIEKPVLDALGRHITWMIGRFIGYWFRNSSRETFSGSNHLVQYCRMP